MKTMIHGSVAIRPSNAAWRSGVRTVAFTCVMLLMSGGTLAVEPHPQWRNSLRPKGEPGPALTLASQGQANYVILLPAEPTTQEAKAAEDLAYWLKQMTGASFAVVREGTGFAPTGREISVGGTHLLQEAAPFEQPLALGDEGYAIAVAGQTLFLCGGSMRGPINTVYALLEEDLGCRWYERPWDEQYGGTREPSTIAQHRELTFRPVARRFVPPLAIRDPYYRNAFDKQWSLHNRTSSTAVVIPEAWGGYMASPLFVHTVVRNLLPAAKYFSEHPDYYAEVGGERKPTQLCLTNPETLAVVTANVIASLQSTPEARIISVSQQDNADYCQCANCKASDEVEGPSGTLLNFVNTVADAVRREFPDRDIRISTLAYMSTIMPPKRIRPRDNVIIQLCNDTHSTLHPFQFVTETQQFQDIMKSWAEAGASIFIWDYVVNFSHYCSPMPNLPVVAPNIRFYVRHGAKGVMLQGNFQQPGGDNAVMRSWIWAKQLWDPSRDTRQLMHDFVYGYYGNAADPMWAYNELVWNIWADNHRKPWTSPTENPLRVDYNFTPDNPFLSKEFLNRSFKLFDEAVALADDAETLRRVRLAKVSILYVKISQWLGYWSKFDSYTPGEQSKMDAVSRRHEDIICRGFLNELEDICRTEQILYFAESGSPNALERIKRWRAMVMDSKSKPQEMAQ